MNPRPLVVVATEAERPRLDSVDVLVCGIGKAAAASATAHRLSTGLPEAVVSFGVAGAYPSSGLRVGDAVVATEVALLDEGLETGEAFVPFGGAELPVPGAAWAATDPVLRERLLIERASEIRVEPGRIGTVSVCAGSSRLARERERSGALCEAMEGAAIALVAARYGVPFAEVRGISNPCGPRDGAAFDLEAGVSGAHSVLTKLVSTS